MDPHSIADPVVTRFAQTLRAAYGARLERAVLFGSRARGDHRPDSDYDVAVFLHDHASLWSELGALARLTTEILMDTGALISAQPLQAGQSVDAMPLLREIARDGVPL